MLNLARQMVLRGLVASRLVGAVAAGAVAWAIVCVGACASPTLPLPPPLAPSVSQGPDADHVTLTAMCNTTEQNVVVVVVNEGGGQFVPPGEAVGGAIADSCGAWQTTMFAHRGDALVVTYQLSGQISLPTMVTVR